MQEAILYAPMPDLKVRCTACRRYCLLANGQTGFCGIRTNVGGKLYLANFGRIVAKQLDPIEKKPIIHAHPNSLIYSIGTSGCDFACKFCQNYDISQRRTPEGYGISPAEIVEEAIDYGCSGIAYTYNEPTIFAEFAAEVGKLAHDQGLFNIFVTNGYETPDAVKFISNFLDFVTVDFKGNASEQFYRQYMSVPHVEEIFDTLALFIKHGVHTEITDLVVPNVGDSLTALEKMLDRIMAIAGRDIPISFLRFHPDYKMMDSPYTSLSTLDEHYEAATRMGFRYVYVGNVPGSEKQNTYCPSCGRGIIKRDLMHTFEINLHPDGRCSFCGYQTGITNFTESPGHRSRCKTST